VVAVAQDDGFVRSCSLQPRTREGGLSDREEDRGSRQMGPALDQDFTGDIDRDELKMSCELRGDLCAVCVTCSDAVICDML
jgi:hypothetical protein